MLMINSAKYSSRIKAHTQSRSPTPSRCKQIFPGWGSALKVRRTNICSPQALASVSKSDRPIFRLNGRDSAAEMGLLNAASRQRFCPSIKVITRALFDANIDRGSLFDSKAVTCAHYQEIVSKFEMSSQVMMQSQHTGLLEHFSQDPT